MWSVYGDRMPLRWLEHLMAWKQREMANAALLRAAVPGLEPQYERLLREWEALFARTFESARSSLRASLATAANAGDGTPGPATAGGRGPGRPAENRPAPAPAIAPAAYGSAGTDRPPAATAGQPADRQTEALTPAAYTTAAYHTAAELSGLTQASRYQTREFVRQLRLLQAHSVALQNAPAAAALLAHIRRDSELFLKTADEAERQTVIRPNEEPEPASLRSLQDGDGQAGRQDGGAGETELPDRSPSADAAAGGAQPERAADDVRPERTADGSAEEPARTGDAAGVDPLRPEGVWSGSPVSPAGISSVPIGGHTLLPLPYPYNALEPYIDETTMRLHHDKHHRSYVEGLNRAEKKLEEARKTGDFALVKHWERELAFHGAGHYLHTLFWETMSPKGGGQPDGELARQIARDFGSFDAFRRQFAAAAENVEGGGWAILVWSPRSRRLEILTAEKHQNLSQWDVVPLLPLDVWEHAYYLKHQNNRAAYIRDWWHVVNWPKVAERFRRARTLQWQPW